MDKTIVGIATSLGRSAINIIRVSGNDSIKKVSEIFKNKDLEKQATHTINYGHIIHENEIIDEVLVSIMKAPKSYTGEDVVEINCHGGIATTNKILEILLLKGCILAEPGEFTKRAFLNGRIDLIKAEGIMDLIRAKTDDARKLAINQIEGHVSVMIRNLRQEILEILANIEVNIDYPEYEDIEEITNTILSLKIKDIKTKINKILEESNSGKIIKEGIKTVIIGRPNVGKSSLLNMLIKEEKAIVTNIAGTTRDIVEGTLNLNGILLNLVDTAGIRETEDLVESIGVKKSFELINEADLLLLILANNEILSDEEKQIFEKIKEKNHIVIINKSDLNTKLDTNLIESEYIINLSVKNNEGIDKLKQTIKEIYNFEKIKEKDFNYLTSSRVIAILKQITILIIELENSIMCNMPVDILEIDIKKIWELLGEILGETYQEELIDQLFSQFCLGK